MFPGARWLRLNRLVRFGFALAFLAVVHVVAASDAPTLITGVDAHSIAGGTEVLVQTEGRPHYTAYLLNEPLRLAIDFEQTSLTESDLSHLPSLDAYIQKVEGKPFYGRHGKSVRLEFFLRDDVAYQLAPSDGGLLVSFYGGAPSLSEATDSAELPAAEKVEDSSGLSLDVLNVEPRADSVAFVQVAESIDLSANSVADPVAETPESLGEEMVASEPLEDHVAPALSLTSPLDTSPAVDGVTATSEEKLADELVASVVKPVAEEVWIDYRELEEARTVGDSLVAAGKANEFITLAQADSPAGIDVLSGMDASSTRFSGRPISFDVKKVDIVELLRVFSDLTQMNILIDRGVRGRVTAKLRDVPWDQAFIIILKNQGLGFTIEQNILRVAPLKTLRREIRDQQRLREARLVSEPLNTEIVYVNYANPKQLLRMLKPQLSRRGKILSDARTNTLMIRDVQQNIDKAKRMVEILDVRTKQISISAQIVRANKNFTRDLGIEWGGTLEASPRLGNDTGLNFPNDISSTFGISVPGGGTGTVAFDFGNVLDSVNINAILGASEAVGLTKTISTPQVTTSDNVAANLSSGVNIPYVSTTITGGVAVGTIVFQSATTSIRVTPHVTSDGFIKLKVQLSNNFPSAFTVEAGPVIATNSLRTEVLVRDGDTFVVGGLNSSVEGTSQTRVPWFHKIPFLGNLFKNNSVTNDYTD